jgi:hypothetical protein
MLVKRNWLFCQYIRSLLLLSPTNKLLETRSFANLCLELNTTDLNKIDLKKKGNAGIAQKIGLLVTSVPV